MDIQDISRTGFAKAILMAIAATIVLVGAASLLGRATLNLQAALTDKPDVAVYLLLPEEEISSVELLRETEGGREYLVETVQGPKYVRLRKGEKTWYVVEVERLHE